MADVRDEQQEQRGIVVRKSKAEGRGIGRRIGPYQEDSSKFPGKMDRVFM